jgi:hypothetical protein
MAPSLASWVCGTQNPPLATILGMLVPRSLTVFFVAAFLALIVSLAAGLRTYHFRPGIFSPPAGMPSEIARISFPPPAAVLEAIKYAVWVMTGLGILALLVSRENRRKILWIIVPIMLAALITFFFPAPPKQEPSPQLSEVPHGEVSAGGNQIPVEPETTGIEPLTPPRLPPWPLFLLGGLVLAAMLWFLWDQSKRKASEEKKEFSFSPPPSTKPEGMVAQLWWHMVEVLSAKAGMAGIPKTHTARELAELLFRHFPNPAIWELTELFEEVRYGKRSDTELAFKARAALAKIEEL